MTVVIDIGAARYGGDHSIERLIEQFDPTDLYAIDANPALLDSIPERTSAKIHVIQKAAWIFDGEVAFVPDGLNGWVTDLVCAEKVPCLDTARFIREVEDGHNDNVVLKIDAEASEYDILPHLIDQHADELLDLLIVEWHERVEVIGPAELARRQRARRKIESRLKCPFEEWPY